MLMVSELLAVARAAATKGDLVRRSPQRFSKEKPAAPVIVWNICHHCNMSCPHCYASAGKRPALTDLSTDEALRIIDDLASSGVGVIIFSGGEPLMREDVFTLIERAKARGVSPQLSTNGVLIDEPTAARLRQVGVSYVGISIDGVAAFNDPYRGLERAFERALEGARQAKQAGMKVGIRMTLTRRNRDQLEQMLEVAAGVSADRFYLSHLVYAGRGRKLTGDDLTPAETRALLLRTFELADARLDQAGPRIVTGSNDSDGVLLLRWVRERHGDEAAARVHELLLLRGGNSAGEGVMSIDHQGRVHPDQFWQGEQLGDLRREPFSAVLASPFRDMLRNRQQLLTGRCGACKHVALCRGSHRERAIATSQELWGPDPSCVLEDHEVLS